MPLTGHVDARNRVLTVVLPATRFGLHSGEMLNDVQFFSLIGSPYAETQENTLRLVGITTSVSAGVS